MNLPNPYEEPVVFIGFDEAEGKAWQFRAEFYHGDGGGYMLHTYEYEKQDNRWVLVDSPPMIYFEIQSEIMDYLYDSNSQGSEFIYPKRLSSLKELGVALIRKES